MAVTTRSIYLDPVTKDLALTSTKNLRLTTTNGEYVAQKIETVLSFFLGEWFLDYTEGTPYFESIFKKNPDLNLVNTALRNRIVNKIEEVEEIIKFETEFDTSLRQYSLDLEVRSITGDIVSFQTYV